MALYLIGSYAPTGSAFPTYFMIGTGSSYVYPSDTTLYAPHSRQVCSSINGSTPYKVKWQGDWSAAGISGITLRDFGVCLSGPTTTGSMWSRTTLPGFTFDGSTELRIEEIWEVC